MIALTVGDIHLKDRTPASRLDNYRQTSFDELRQIRQIALDEKVDAVFCTGDIFDDPAATRNSHSLVCETINLFKSFPCPVYSIVGNHDISYHRQDTIDKQPLGVLFASGAVKKLDREVIKGVEFVGVHYDEANSYETLSFEKKPRKKLIAVCHVLASLDGGDMFGEAIYSYKQLADQSGVDVYVFGHYHHDQGIQKVGDKQFVNLGAIARGALNEDNIYRQVKVGRIELADGELHCSEINLNMRPAAEIFDLEQREEIKDRQKEIEKFVATLATNQVFDNLSSLEESIKKKDLELPVRSRLLGYLNARGAGIPL